MLYIYTFNRIIKRGTTIPHSKVGGRRKNLYSEGMVIAAHAICVRTTMLSTCSQFKVSQALYNQDENITLLSNM